MIIKHDEDESHIDEFFAIMGMAATAVLIYKAGRFVGRVRAEVTQKMRETNETLEN